MGTQKKTDWGSVAKWYNEHLAGTDTYHTKVILPNLTRLVAPKPNAHILDLACGTGFMSRAFSAYGAAVTGIDLGKELIETARKTEHKGTPIEYRVLSAEKLTNIPNTLYDAVNITLAIQNIQNAGSVFKEAARVMKANGSFHITMNHPCFRIPKKSEWHWDKDEKGAVVQKRVVTGYLSEYQSTIQMNPGDKKSKTTISFHRPIQWYMKELSKAGMAIVKIEEWISHRESEPGPRAHAENIARKEIPLFLYIQARKI